MVQRHALWARLPSLGLLSATVLGLGGCFLILDFSEDVPTQDAGPVDAGESDAAPVDATPGADANLDYEANNSLATAFDISAQVEDVVAAISPIGDHDFYLFNVAADTDLTLTLSFANSDGSGDLNMNLRTADGTLHTEAFGDEETEVIEHSATLGNRLVPAVYVVEVFSASETTSKNYVLKVALTQ